MNIQNTTNDLLCSGCGTCNTVCNHNAISMEKTPSMGLLYAKVDKNKCINCGLCLKMCPSAHAIEQKRQITQEDVVGNIKGCYVGRTLNHEIFSNAQSGGIATAILRYLLEQQLVDAVISCRMEYGNPRPEVRYTIIAKSEELKKNQRSCYTQVDIVSALRETGGFKSVAVVGVPCHIQGISNLLRLKKFANVKYRIGLVCDKTYSDAYMDAIMFGERKPHGDVCIKYRQKNFAYRGVFYSYQNAPTVLENKLGEMTILPNSKRMFLKDYFALPKCKICWDKLNVQADIVLGDPWGLKGQYDAKEGDSLVIIRSETAEVLISNMQAIGLINIHDVKLADVIKGQRVEVRVKEIHDFDFKQKQKIWQNCERKDRSALVKRVNDNYRRELRIRKIKSVIKQIIRLR